MPDLNDLNSATLFGGMSILVALRYTFVAGLAWLLAYVWFRRRWHHRKIVQKAPLHADVRREILHSARTVFIFALVGLATIWAARQGWTRLYLDLHAHSWSWFFSSIGLTIFLHDAWFYWTHRVMHHRKLFRFFHRTHHLSNNPTPWAAYAFSPAEAVVQASILPIAVVTMPLHPLAFGIFLTWQLVFNVIGHTGYEYTPSWFMKTPLRYFINTPTNHAMHHESMRGNFGLYFNFWDRLMMTNHEDYEMRFVEVTTRERGGVVSGGEREMDVGRSPD